MDDFRRFYHPSGNPKKVYRLREKLFTNLLFLKWSQIFRLRGQCFPITNSPLRKRSSTNRRGWRTIFFGSEKTANGYIFKKDWELDPLPNPKIVEDLQELKISMKPKRTWKVELLEVDFFWSEMHGILQLP